jgi:uncharacterized protein YjbJ (UPF0337 family)
LVRPALFTRSVSTRSYASPRTRVQALANKTAIVLISQFSWGEEIHTKELHPCLYSFRTKESPVRISRRGSVVTNRDQVEGEVREEVGKATDDESMEKEGQAQEGLGDLKDKAADIEDEVRDRT